MRLPKGEQHINNHLQTLKESRVLNFISKTNKGTVIKDCLVQSLYFTNEEKPTQF